MSEKIDNKLEEFQNYINTNEILVDKINFEKIKELIYSDNEYIIVDFMNMMYGNISDLEEYGFDLINDTTFMYYVNSLYTLINIYCKKKKNIENIN